MKFKTNIIYECSYCGERIKSQKYCSNCKTQLGRKKIFDANVVIAKERIKTNLPAPTSFKSWK